MNQSILTAPMPSDNCSAFAPLVSSGDRAFKQLLSDPRVGHLPTRGYSKAFHTHITRNLNTEEFTGKDKQTGSFFRK